MRAAENKIQNQAKSAVMSHVLATYPDALCSAYIVGQALNSLPETESDCNDLAVAMFTLIQLGGIGVLPPPLLEGLKKLDKLLSLHQPFLDHQAKEKAKQEAAKASGLVGVDGKPLASVQADGVSK